MTAIDDVLPADGDPTAALAAALRAAGVGRATRLAVALTDSAVGLAADGRGWSVSSDRPTELVRRLDAKLSPRWTWWDARTPALLTRRDVRVARCWDVSAVHALLFGGWLGGPAEAWAALHDLDPAGIPRLGQLDLLGPVAADESGPDAPVGADGHLRAEWVGGGWARDGRRLELWARTAGVAADRQERRLLAGGDTDRRQMTAWSESAAQLLCAELEVDGLPVDRSRAAAIIVAAAGPAPTDDEHGARVRAERDRRVLSLLPEGSPTTDLRNPAQVKAMLARIGFDLPDTRSWRLEPFRAGHPTIDALVQWRKTERIATTYGHGWLQTSVGPDSRLRGAWSASDGAAGRMTAQAGLHNLPAEMRPAVAAEPGHVLVRADLGQIEPRVLAVVSGDPALARATADDDLYAPVAAQLGVDRPTAKVAVLAAMYGQTSGAAGRTLTRMTQSYPRAIAYLDAAYEDGRAGRDVRTVGGRLVRMPPLPQELDENAERTARAARGRYARNAVVQGAAAEFFKMWAVSVRARIAGTGSRIVLCLHDELLLHVPTEQADDVVRAVRECLDECGHRWQGGVATVRFVVDVSTVASWADAKG